MRAATLPAAWSALVAPLLRAIEERRGPTALVGLLGSAKGCLISTLARQLTGPGPSLLVVASTDEAAESLRADIAFFQQLQGASPYDVLLFPEWGMLPYAATPPPVEVIGQRMRALDRLHRTDRGLVLIVPVTAFLQRLIPRALLAEAYFSLKPPAAIERTHLITRFLRLGYRQASVVENPGEFAVRGGIVDIFSTAHAEPRRIEFLGDAIETIRLFDPATQRSSGGAAELRVLPARELIRDDISPLPPDAEWRGPHVYSTMDTLLDHFPSPPVLIADEPLDVRQHADEFLAEVQEAYDTLESPDPLPAPDQLFLPLGHLWEAGGARCVVTFEAIPRGGEAERARTEDS
ncbi:MAG TPA: hypothetical protein VF879_03555, partial [Nitrospirales bacterium]